MRLPRVPRTLAAAASITVLSFAGPAVSAEPAPPTVAASWTARAIYPAPVFKAPGGVRTGTLRHATRWTQSPAVYLITGSTTYKGRKWVRLLLPGRPNGKQGWVHADGVALKRITTWIRISTKKRTLTVFSNGVVKKRFRVAVGTGGTPTPKGRFAIQDPVPTGGQLGPYIMVLTAHSNVLKTFNGGNGEVAIHGWPSSEVLGKAVSHGCVRMNRSGAAYVARWAKTGTPVEVV